MPKQSLIYNENLIISWKMNPKTGWHKKYSGSFLAIPNVKLKAHLNYISSIVNGKHRWFKSCEFRKKKKAFHLFSLPGFSPVSFYLFSTLGYTELIRILPGL